MITLFKIFKESINELDPYGEEKWNDDLKFQIKQYLDDHNYFYKEIGKNDIFHIVYKNLRFVIYQDKENDKFYINYTYQDMGYDRKKRFEIKTPENIQFYIDSKMRKKSEPIQEEVRWYKDGKLEDDSEWEEEKDPEPLLWEHKWDADYFIKNIFNRVKIKGEFTIEEFIEKFNDLPKEFRKQEKSINLHYEPLVHLFPTYYYHYNLISKLLHDMVKRGLLKVRYLQGIPGHHDWREGGGRTSAVFSKI
jgi:hypothetical protein